MAATGPRGGGANRADTDEGDEVERAGAEGAAARHKTQCVLGRTNSVLGEGENLVFFPIPMSFTNRSGVPPTKRQAPTD